MEPIENRETPVDSTYGEDKTLVEMQKDRLRRQMLHDICLFEQQMQLIKCEVEARTQERERKRAESDLRMQLLQTQLDKAQLELEETKMKIMRSRNSNIPLIKSETLDEDEPSVSELNIPFTSNDIQMVPITNGIRDRVSENMSRKQ